MIVDDIAILTKSFASNCMVASNDIYSVLATRLEVHLKVGHSNLPVRLTTNRSMFVVVLLILNSETVFSVNSILLFSGCIVESHSFFICLALLQGAEYYDEFDCLYVCPCVCPRAHLWNRWTDLHKFCVQIPCGRGSVLLWQCCNTLCTSGFIDDVTFGCSGPYGDAWKEPSTYYH